ncbi:uncharacterized protein APUU_30945S [Aspergillus puulaauensis]|uniref:Uncharacterized protein n=1 Tax=Aspergillus puulaauensis TaxID=1220207 RepID=A0A7R8AMI8_9EURO|nr:uncharacterized protein APUU_30945S [Aspergillus puulaauensis]BCS22720.1 hypothetical protein APUU_30945S [Aspergillus puulaauensis]
MGLCSPDSCPKKEPLTQQNAGFLTRTGLRDTKALLAPFNSLGRIKCTCICKSRLTSKVGAIPSAASFALKANADMFGQKVILLSPNIHEPRKGTACQHLLCILRESQDIVQKLRQKYHSCKQRNSKPIDEKNKPQLKKNKEKIKNSK